MSLGANAPPPLIFGNVASYAMPTDTLHPPSVQAVASYRRISVLHLSSTKAAEPPRRTVALLLPSVQAVASRRRSSVLQLPSTAAAEPPRRTVALRLPSAEAV
eukprot:312018-Pleurochrysis_carterae.AAC.1